MRGMDDDICLYEKELRHDYEKTDAWKEVNDKYQEVLFPEMSEKWGVKKEDLNFTTAYTFIDQYESAHFNKSHIKNDLSPEALKQEDMILRDGLYEGFFGQDIATRLATSRFFSYIRNTFDRKIKTLQGEADPELEFYKELKLLYLSAHDSTVAAIMTALNQAQEKAVPFATYLIVELYLKHQRDGSDPSHYYLVWYYNGERLHIGGTDVCTETKCDYPIASDYFQSREFDGDIDDVCANGLSESNSAAKDWILVLIFVAIAIVVILILYFVIASWLRKRSQDVDSEVDENEKLGAKVNASDIDARDQKLLANEKESDV